MDSTKVEIINKSFDKLVNKLVEPAVDKHSIWDILIPLLIGAGLTLLTQFLIEVYRTRKETRRKRQELISKGRAKTYLIAQIVKDLAMYKVHKQYYFRGYQLSNDPAEKEDDYKKHYEKGQEQRMTESKLDDTIAEYFQLVTEYTIITDEKDNFNEQFQRIFHYVHPKSSRFTDCNTGMELVAGLEKEENRLNAEYRTFCNIFERIQSAMK